MAADGMAELGYIAIAYVSGISNNDNRVIILFSFGINCSTNLMIPNKKINADKALKRQYISPHDRHGITYLNATIVIVTNGCILYSYE